ncbi:MAG: hypothetical protein QOG77_3250 [Solirubrobacteraceae bacterium]|nr:hypothetical protein [Solirubrobacteraceae bacterium]
MAVVRLAAVVRFAPGAGDGWVATSAPLLRDLPGVDGVVLNVAGDAIGVGERTKDLELGFASWAVMEERLVKDAAGRAG